MPSEAPTVSAVKEGPDTGASPELLFPETDFLRVQHRQSPFPSLPCSLLICGDAHQALDLLPDASVQAVVTSPPYWSLRDYGVADQIGRDDGLPDYVAAIVRVFAKLQRVLRPDGTGWLTRSGGTTACRTMWPPSSGCLRSCSGCCGRTARGG